MVMDRVMDKMTKRLENSMNSLANNFAVQLNELKHMTALMIKEQQKTNQLLEQLLQRE